MAMTTREQMITFCKTFEQVVEDYPFDDPNFTAMRHKGGKKKIFALIFQRQGHIWVNVKNQPGWCDFWRSQYPSSVLPGYHMNKQHWNSLILNGSIDSEHLRQMVQESYLLTQK